MRFKGGVFLLIAANGMFCGYVSLPKMKMSVTQSFISVVSTLLTVV